MSGKEKNVALAQERYSVRSRYELLVGVGRCNINHPGKDAGI